ncbi:substrate-binding periplasmic protein [Aliiglaciecola litoralis]|uniref:Transporter substrate-binding domain-containing protein n=1 Tax=Aliiglaciecola litoralis TaxID=582857 RepID=A0ABN1LQS0_9ALTE
MKTTELMLAVVASFTLFACSPEQGSSSSTSKALSDSDLASAMEIDKNQPECAVSLGFDVWDPYQYVDVDGKVRGLDIEVIRNILLDMDCSVTYVRGTWVSLLEDLKQGNVDLLLGASKTEAREEYAMFSDPYRMEEFTLYIRKDDTPRVNYQDISDFIENGSKIGVVGDYYYGPRISALLDGETTKGNFVTGIMGELNIARLLDLDIDGFLEDSFVGASILRRKALNNYIVPHSFTVNTGDIYVMFSKESVDPYIVDRFNERLEDFKASGAYDQIMAKYSQ